MRLPLLALIGVAVVLQAGCVTGRRSLSLPVSTHDVPSRPAGRYISRPSAIIVISKTSPPIRRFLPSMGMSHSYLPQKRIE